MVSYAALLQNMVLLRKRKLSDVSLELIEKLCRSDIPSTILANLLKSD